MNVLVTLTYWAVRTLTGCFFHRVGVLPMPVWLAAAVAVIAGFCWGWSITPALAAGTVLANHYSLGTTWTYTACVAIMNTLGPLCAVWLVNRKTSVTPAGIGRWFFWLIAGGLFTALALTASSGIGSQLFLGMIQWGHFGVKSLRVVFPAACREGFFWVWLLIPRCLRRG